MGFQKYYVIIRVGHGRCLRPLTRWVGGVKKGQKNDYVIFEWSLMRIEKTTICFRDCLSFRRMEKQDGLGLRPHLEVFGDSRQPM